MATSLSAPRLWQMHPALPVLQFPDFAQPRQYLSWDQEIVWQPKSFSGQRPGKAWFQRQRINGIDPIILAWQCVAHSRQA